MDRALLCPAGARHERSELVRLSGISKQQLSRLKNGQIRLRLDHLKPFASHLGYTPEQILLWGRFPGTGGAAGSHVESSDVLREEPAQEEPLGPAPGQVPELDTRAGLGGGGVPARELRKEGHHADPLKPEGWLFPQALCANNCTPPPRAFWCSTPPATAWPRPSRRGSALSSILLIKPRRPTNSTQFAIHSTASSSSACNCCARRGRRGENHFRQSNHPSEEVPLSELEIVGKVLCGLKLF